jgi:hypothetical protein
MGTQEILSYFIYSCFVIWALVASSYIYKLNKKGIEKINHYFYNSIPTVFTTLGILGTFLGISIGLKGFDVNNIEHSIPDLLAGLKTAFLTSIVGIILSLIFSWISEAILHVKERETKKSDTELNALNKIVNILDETKSKNRDENKNISDNLLGIKNTFIEKFDTLSQQITKSSTDALLKMMEGVIKEFSEKMQELLEGLVNQNFKTLSTSIENLNDWQEKNKIQVETLIRQFNDTTNNVEQVANHVKSITKNTEKLISEDGELSTLIKELQSVMIEEKVFTRITHDLQETTNGLTRWLGTLTPLIVAMDQLTPQLAAIDIPKKLSDLDENFYKRLNDTFNALEDLTIRVLDRLEEKLPKQ